jgi:hypothetical protein
MNKEQITYQLLLDRIQILKEMKMSYTRNQDEDKIYYITTQLEFAEGLLNSVNKIDEEFRLFKLKL